LSLPEARVNLPVLTDLALRIVRSSSRSACRDIFGGGFGVGRGFGGIGQIGLIRLIGRIWIFGWHDAIDGQRDADGLRGFHRRSAEGQDGGYFFLDLGHFIEFELGVADDEDLAGLLVLVKEHLVPIDLL
ncbi:MAG: hypothetical protein ACK56I_22470, partial [bacterium]